MIDYTTDETRSEGIVHASGELTIEHAVDLRDVLMRALGENEGVTLDLSGVSETDITALQLVLSAAKTAGNTRRRLNVEGLSRAVEDAARAAGFSRFPG